MAYTVDQLSTFFKNANAGTGPTAAQTLTLQALANQNAAGTLTNDQALSATVDLAADSTTGVSVGAYQFFLGYAPSEAGLASLNAAYVGTGSQASLNGESRFIAQSISLALQNPTAKANFANAYGSLSVEDATKAAYNIIIGNAAAAAAGIDVSKSIAFLTGQTAYYTAFVKQVLPGLSAEDQALAVKAAIIGEILFVATSYNNGAGLGSYATATTALIKDLADDGHLVANNANGVDLFANYGTGGTGSTILLTPGADTTTGTGGNDTINALTVKADGADATTFSSFDTIDGGAGTDTLNIYVDDTKNLNDAFPTSATVKNVEIVNVLNANTAIAGLADVSKYTGVQQLWQVNTAAGVTNLAAGVTAGFRNVAQSVTATTTATATSAAIALDKFADSDGGGATTITVDGSGSDALGSLTITGTVVDGVDAGTGVAAVGVTLKVGVDVQSVTYTSAIASTLTINDTGSTDKVTSVNLSGSTGATTFVGDAEVATITGGAAKDTLTIATATAVDNAATPSVNEKVSAVLDAGAGNDVITINTTGAGTTTVTAGAGNDSVTHTGHGTGVLTVDLGDGNDSFKGAGVVTANDSVNGGAGTDTLLLSVVGVANIGAFSNFEVFDANGLGKALDVDILATKNTVTEFVTSGDVGVGAALTNLGAGVGYRVVADTTLANGMTLTQKTAGALTVTLDIDEAADATTVSTNHDATVTAANATSLTAVFDSSFAGKAASATDNVANLALTGTAATTLAVVSGGAEASNKLDYTSGVSGADAVLTTVSVTGSSALALDLAFGAGAVKVTSVDASAFTGALTFNTADLQAESAANTFDGGVLKLGAGSDVITVTQGASLQGFAKGSAEGLTTQTGFDVVKTVAGLSQAADAATNGTSTIKDGLLTFDGAGPATLAAAVTLVDARVAVDGAAVVFEYLGNSYIFINNDTTADTVVKLVGVTGLHGLDEVGTSDGLYVF